MSAFLVLTTVSNRSQARKLASLLLKHKAAACVTFLPGAESHYRWKGRIEKAREVILLIKTGRAAYARLDKLLKVHHPYEIPEIIALPAAKGSQPYLDWVRRETRPGRS